MGAIFGGIGFIVSSLAILASAAIWTWIRYNPEKFETEIFNYYRGSGGKIPERLELHAGTWVAYFSMVAEFLGGILLIFSSRRSYRDYTPNENNHSQPPQTSTA